MADYYTATGQPANKSSLTSSVLRAEFAAVASGLAKIAPYTGHGGEVLRINAGATAQESVPFSTLLATITNLVIAGTLTGVTDLTTTGNTVLGNAQADTLNVGAGDIQKDASGRTGFGVAPAAKVHAKGSGEVLRIETTTVRGSGAAYLDFYDPTGQKGYIGFQGANDLMSLWNALNGAVLIGSNNAEIARFDTTGLGVGVTPASTLHVKSGAASIVRVETTAVRGGGKPYIELFDASGAKGYVGHSATLAADDRLYLWNVVNADILFGINNAEQMHLSTNGLGINATPSAWGSIFKVLQIAGNGVAFSGRTDAQQLNASVNWYFDGATNRYIANGPASKYSQDTGVHLWYYAAAGVAGAAVTFTEALRITNAGVIQDGAGNELGFKDLPFSGSTAKVAPYTIVAADRGTAVVMNTASNVTIPTGLPAGSVIVIYNNSGSALTIVQGGGVTLRLDGTALTGNRTLAANGKAVLWCFSSPTYSLGGSGVT